MQSLARFTLLVVLSVFLVPLYKRKNNRILSGNG